jgi:hypothetical protein
MRAEEMRAGLQVFAEPWIDEFAWMLPATFAQKVAERRCSGPGEIMVVLTRRTQGTIALVRLYNTNRLAPYKHSELRIPRDPYIPTYPTFRQRAA